MWLILPKERHPATSNLGERGRMLCKMYPPARDQVGAQSKEDPGQVETKLHQFRSHWHTHRVPWNLAIKVWSACSFSWPSMCWPHLPAPYLEKPLLLSHLRLSGPHGVLRQRHRRKVWMRGSQHRIDSSAHQRALLKGLMIQSGKNNAACFRPSILSHFNQCHQQAHHTCSQRKNWFNNYLYNSNAMKASG